MGRALEVYGLTKENAAAELVRKGLIDLKSLNGLVETMTSTRIILIFNGYFFSSCIS